MESMAWSLVACRLLTTTTSATLHQLHPFVAMLQVSSFIMCIGISNLVGRDERACETDWLLALSRQAIGVLHVCTMAGYCGRASVECGIQSGHGVCLSAFSILPGCNKGAKPSKVSQGSCQVCKNGNRGLEEGSSQLQSGSHALGMRDCSPPVHLGWPFCAL